jgi:hypothetical protein
VCEARVKLSSGGRFWARTVAEQLLGIWVEYLCWQYTKMVDWKQVTGFDWDTGNGRRSEEKQAARRLEAEQVFFNQPQLVFAEQKHGKNKVRYHALGVSNQAAHPNLARGLAPPPACPISRRNQPKNKDVESASSIGNQRTGNNSVDQSLDLIKKFASVQKTHQHGDAPAAPHYPRDDRVPLPERVYFIGVVLMPWRVRQFWQNHRHIQCRKESKRPDYKGD